MQIYIVKKSVGNYDSHRNVDIKAFRNEDEANAFKAELEKEHATKLKVLARVSVWYDKWVKANPEPARVQEPYSWGIFQLTPEQEEENHAVYDAWSKSREEWFQRWYKSYLAYAKLHGFEPAPETESSLVRGYEDDHNCIGGFYVTPLELA